MLKSTSKLFAEISRLSNKAVKNAQEENRRKGIPNVYSINGKLVYELPDGKLTSDYQFYQTYYQN